MNHNPSNSILVVDDNPSVITFIRTVLSRDDFDIESAADLQAGFEALASSPLLVIVDLTLGDESGIPLIEHAAGRTPQPGIIAISGSGAEALDQAVMAGARGNRQAVLGPPSSNGRLRIEEKSPWTLRTWSGPRLDRVDWIVRAKSI